MNTENAVDQRIVVAIQMAAQALAFYHKTPSILLNCADRITIGDSVRQPDRPELRCAVRLGVGYSCYDSRPVCPTTLTTWRTLEAHLKNGINETIPPLTPHMVVLMTPDGQEEARIEFTLRSGQGNNTLYDCSFTRD